MYSLDALVLLNILELMHFMLLFPVWVITQYGSIQSNDDDRVHQRVIML